jgi:hypothetical protein
MGKIMVSNSKKVDKKASRGKIDPHMKDYGKEPFFVRKTEASKKVVGKYGLPDSPVNDKK